MNSTTRALKYLFLAASVSLSAGCFADAGPQAADLEVVPVDQTGEGREALSETPESAFWKIITSSEGAAARANKGLALLALQHEATLFERRGLVNFTPLASLLSDSLRADRAFMTKAVEANGVNGEYATGALKGDLRLILTAMTRGSSEKDYPLLARYPERVRRNRKIVLAALSHNGQHLHWASRRFLDDKDVVLHAMRHTIVSHWADLPHPFEMASARLQDDREVLRAALVSERWFPVLGSASAQLRADKEVALLAVRAVNLVRRPDDGELKYVAKTLQDDFDVVLASVTEWSSTLKYASSRLQADPAIVAAAAASAAAGH